MTRDDDAAASGKPGRIDLELEDRLRIARELLDDLGESDNADEGA